MYAYIYIDICIYTCCIYNQQLLVPSLVQTLLQTQAVSSDLG